MSGCSAAAARVAELAANLAGVRTRINDVVRVAGRKVCIGIPLFLIVYFIQYHMFFVFIYSFYIIFHFLFVNL